MAEQARRLFPHPLMSVLLTVMWMALTQFTLGNLILGGAFGILIPVATQPYWQQRMYIRKPLVAIEYSLIVLWDIIVANTIVAAIILFKRNDKIQSQWICVPTDLRRAEAIFILASTITMTPGTVSAMLAADGHSILVHTLDTDDPDAVRDEIKNRYERRLLEIFP